jgi:hypothetical protein
MGAFLSILSSLLGGVAKVGGAIGQGIGTVAGGIGQGVGNVAQGIGGGVGKVGSTIGSGIEGLLKNLTTGGEPIGAGGEQAPTGLKGLFSNKLLAQLLASEGADLMGNTPGKNLGGALQQNIASQNYAKMLSQILGGKASPPDGITYKTSGNKSTLEFDHEKHPHPLPVFDPSVGDVLPVKASMTGSNIPGLQVDGARSTPGGVPIQPTDWLQAGMGLSNPFPISQPAMTAPAPAGAEAQVPTTVPMAETSTPQDPMVQLLTQMLGGGQVNPAAGFANLRPADLAGVSPEMLSQALQFKMQQEQLGKKNVMDVMDLMMRGKELGMRAPYMKALTDEAIDRVASNQPIINIGGIPYNTAEYLKWQQVQKENLSTNQKDYSTYAAQEAAAGRQPKSFEEFLNNNFTSDIKNYRLYVDQEKAAGRTPKDFDPWLTEHEGSRATRISIGEKAQGAAAVARATSTVDAQSQISDPAKRSAAIQKGFANLGMDEQLTLQTGTPEEQSNVKNISAAQTIENQIIAAGGRIVGRDKNAKQMIWRVVWPPATEGEKERSETITQPRY